MRVVDNLVNELYNHGIDTYFIVTGGVISPFVDAVGSNKNVKYFCFQHEQSASMAAEGYYRACGKIAAVLVTSGPGAQNLLNGICGCWYDSIPVLFVTGQVNTKESLDSIKSKPRQLGFQETPVVPMFENCTLYSEKIQNSEDVSRVFSNALTNLKNSRKGPVHVDFPIDVQFQTDVNVELHVTDTECDTYNGYEDVSKIVKNFKRPLVVIGAGARNCDIEKWLNVPFVTSWGGYDIIKHGNKLHLGNHGIYGDRVANFALQNADLLIILGSRMDTRQTGSNTKACSTKSFKIMVDVDNEEIEKLNERGFKIDIPIVDTVSNFIKNVTLDSCAEWSETVNMWKNEFGPEKRDGNVYIFLENIKLPDECIVIPDIGGNLVWTLQSMRLKQGQQLFTNLGNASMGCSLPMAIGAHVAKPDTHIVSINGDGGIMMNIQELETIRHLNIPITIIVINNNGHGIIRQFQDSYFGSRYIASSGNDIYKSDNGINIANIGNGFGIKSYRINTDHEIRFSDFPVLYDVEIDTQQKIYPKMEFGSTLENMAPKRPELLKYMLI